MMIYKKLLTISLAFFFALFLAAPWGDKSVRADGTVSLFLQPANGDIVIGGPDKSVEFKITPNGRQVVAVQIELQYIYDDITITDAVINSSLSGDLTEMAGSHDGVKKYALTFTTPIAQDVTLATFKFKAVRSQPKVNVDVLLGNAKVVLANSNESLTSSNGGVSLQDAQYNLVTAVSTPTPTPTPTPVPVTTYTECYRIAESLADLAGAECKPYVTNGVTIGYDFITAGQKFLFVQFEGKDSTGRTVKTTMADCPNCQANIKVLGDPPSIGSCALSFEGSSTTLTLQAGKDESGKIRGFGPDKGTAKSGDTAFTAEQIKLWKNDRIQIVWPNPLTGPAIPVSLTNPDGQTAEGWCGSISTIALGANKVFCRAPSKHQTDNVDLILVEATAGGKLVRQKVTIDKDGIIQGLTQQLLEKGKDYKLSLKAPRSLRRTAPFSAGEGITNLPNFILPVGDVFPTDGGDGKINILDRSELVRQWSLTADATGKSGDFNRDGRVNSIDWACMKNDFNKSDDPEPTSPLPCGPGIAAGTAGCVIPSSNP